MDRHMDEQTDISNSRVAFATGSILDFNIEKQKSQEKHKEYIKSVLKV